MFNSRRPKIKLVPEWDLQRFLQKLQIVSFEPIKSASLKTVFLITITSFRRCSELQSLRLGQYTEKRNNICYTRLGKNVFF